MAEQVNREFDNREINPDGNLTGNEVQAFLRYSEQENYSLDKLSTDIDNNPKLKKLIYRDYAKINSKERIGYGKTLTDVQQRFVDLGFDLGHFGKQKNGVDGSFGKLTFLAIVKLQKVLGLEANGIIDLTLLRYLFPKSFQGISKFGRKKFEKEVKTSFIPELFLRTPDEVLEDIQTKLELFNNTQVEILGIHHVSQNEIPLIAEGIQNNPQVQPEQSQVQVQPQVQQPQPQLQEDTDSYYNNPINFLKTKIGYLNILNENGRLSPFGQKELNRLQILLSKSQYNITSQLLDEPILTQSLIEENINIINTPTDYYTNGKKLADFIIESNYHKFKNGSYCGLNVGEMLDMYGITGLPQWGRDGYTWAKILAGNSKFIKEAISNPSEAKPGGILVYDKDHGGSKMRNKYGHVEIALGNDQYYFGEVRNFPGGSVNAKKDPEAYGFIGYVYYPA